VTLLDVTSLTKPHFVQVQTPFEAVKPGWLFMRVLQPSQDQLYPKSSNKLIFSSSVIENLPLYLGKRRIILTTHALIPKLIRGHIILPSEALFEDKSVKTDPKAPLYVSNPGQIMG
jgi:hypothetical protein